MQPRLTRTRRDRMISGVCGGLGHYFGVDPVIVRLIFVVLAITTFLTPLIYPVLWLIMPEEGTSYSSSSATMPLPPDARFDPMTGQPLPPGQTIGTPPIDPASQQAGPASGRNRTVGFLLAGFGGIVLVDQISDALATVFNIHIGNMLIPLLLVGAGIFLLRKQPV